MSRNKISNLLLVRHPAPRSTESLYGYILRLAGVNGYVTPWTVFVLAGMSQYQTRPTSIHIGNLTGLANRPASELRAIAYSPARDFPRIPRLLGGRVRSFDLRQRRPRICPWCVEENGYIEAQWELTFMTGCPIHQRSALSHCPGCRKPLSWFRRGLLECRCGATLTGNSCAPLSQAVCDLVDIIRCTVLDMAVDDDHPLGAPAKPLRAMTLHSLLGFIRWLGATKLRTIHSYRHSNDNAIVSAAADALADWPRNFYVMLSEVGESAGKQTQAAGIASQFERVYKPLFKFRRIVPSASSDFFQKAFVDFAANHWQRGIVDPKLLEQFGISPSKQFLTKADVSRHFGVMQQTATRLLRAYNVPRILVGRGASKHFLYDITNLDLHESSPGSLMRLRNAAKRVGISGLLLAWLKKNGHYVSHLPTSVAFHESDVDAFKNRFLSLVDGAQKLKGKEECVTLGQVMRKNESFGVVAALLSGQLPAVGNIDGTVKGLLIPRRMLVTFKTAKRTEMHGGAKTPTEVAKRIGCCPLAVPALFSCGLLTGKRVPRGLRISEDSIDRFNRHYVCLSVLAKQLNTGANWLAHDCRRLGIKVIRIAKEAHKTGEHQPIIRKKDAGRLMQRKTPLGQGTPRI